MLLNKDKSCLLLIDVQEKLTPLVMGSTKLVGQCAWLMRLANELHVPLIISEQYPQGLGKTVAPLTVFNSIEPYINKVSFSCWQEPTFKEQLNSLDKKQAILIGIETHVCILQTAMDLIDANFEVYVVVDAVSSRFESDHNYGLKRMKQRGIQLVTAEMMFFEWVKQAGTPDFKRLSKLFL